jgi:hypothetical protein
MGEALPELSADRVKAVEEFIFGPCTLVRTLIE